MKRLFVYFAGIGDLIIFIPLFRKLAEGGQLDILVRPHGVPLFEGQDYIGRTVGLLHPNRGREGVGRLLLGGHRRSLGRKLKQEKYDEIIITSEERPVIRDWIEGWRGNGELRTMTYPDHDPERLGKGFESMGLDPADRDPYPRIDVSDSQRKLARDRLSRLGGRVLSVQAGASPSNRWFRKMPNLKGLTAVQWAGLISDILEGSAVDAVVFHGTDRERREVGRIMEAAPQKYREQLNDWTGSVGIGNLRAVLAESYAMVSIDTGPAHMAAAVGCPLLVFFGPSDPKEYPIAGDAPVEIVTGSAPCQFCMGTPVYKKCRDNICMQSLSREKLFEGWEKLKGRVDGSRRVNSD